ncbi:MAG: trimeric intracellular cation channel family protein [Natronospirillum sp.]|uniref:trimeric intracellular cation channel family protein n=1 Tax=Natronospirillum sp. TaxID=2812955 RepID=UPI0025FB2B85|nr:trimeric intracellular cation channel family protein [Natronospirillum sp.]MCH8550291.1 trimeric intracellular cation channel family protein [Natronospirillum sp.]
MLLYYLDLAGVAVFAASGVLATRDRELDLLGVIVVATLTAIGGGTLRDLLLDRHPIFWIVDTTYLLVILGAAATTLIYLRFRHAPGFLFQVADALGLALFALSGASLTLAAGFSPLIAVLMGTMTGVTGGILRDVITAHVPLVLRREIYATAAIGGICAYLLLLWLGAPESLAFLVGLALVVLLRLLGFYRGLHLPTLKGP